MEMATIPVVLSLWLGILTSVSPCPLAANIAAVSFIVKGGTRASVVLFSGIAYTLGRAFCLHSAWLGDQRIAAQRSGSFVFFADHNAKILGPVLIVTGLLLLGVFSFAMPGLAVSQERR